MLDHTPLYPISGPTRECVSLDGLWRFSFDPDGRGVSQGWTSGLPKSISMPVPGAFADLFTTRKERDYCGDFWYETAFFLPERFPARALIRFGSVTHRADVYVNGVKCASHEGGFLPFLADVSAIARRGAKNTLVVRANNELSETTIPCGRTQVLADGSRLARPYFDFYNYSGIQRSVQLIGLPDAYIRDYSIACALGEGHATVRCMVDAPAGYDVRVALMDDAGHAVAHAQGRDSELHVANPRLWRVRDAYLYTIAIELLRGDEVVDRYEDRIGIRTVQVCGEQLVLNGEPVYLKGYGKHEDFDVIGRSFSYSVAKRDFELMKWSGANCFRTSHYPYDEGWYRMADEEGFLIIDEVPAVGMMPSLANFLAAGTGQSVAFFGRESTPALKACHARQIREMMARDKNHPSVIAWSLLNEPETVSDAAGAYFADIFALARTLDMQHRPLTGALESTSSPERCKVYPLMDFICLNRYYGWYVAGGPELGDAMVRFDEEMARWAALDLNKPFVFTEFGADTLGTEHKLPSVMWAQEYQKEYLDETFAVFDRYSFVQGELVWNFADFQTVEGIMRVNGNRKGVFTRNRQPKAAAYLLRERWAKK